MKILTGIEQNSPEWLEERRGRITGSKLSGILAKRGTGRKVGFYELIAERLGIPADGESAMDRGHRLEPEAIAEFEGRTGNVVETGMFCLSDFSESVALSPDGLIRDADGKYTQAVEVKCLGSARHIQAVIEDAIPPDYESQALQYFIVNEELETLHFVFYDPRMVARPYHCVRMARGEVSEKAEAMRQYQIDTLSQIEEIISNLEFN